MTDLRQVQHLKQRKLRSAESSLRLARIALAEEKKRLLDAEKGYERHHHWRITEEARIYQSIDKKILSLAKLDECRQRIANMYKQESELKQSVLECERNVNVAKEEESECRQALLDAEKHLEKINLLLAEQLANEARNIELQSESTLDDFASALHQRTLHEITPDERGSHVDTIH